jgi:hypothetical protein
MDSNPIFSPENLVVHIAGDIARAVSGRSGESPAERSLRVQVATDTILGFFPRDMVEAMLAGHCVMLHEVIVDSVRFTLSREVETTRRATRGTIVAMDKAFGNDLDRLARYRADHAAASGDADKVDALAETEIADRVRRHQAGTPAEAAETKSVARESAAHASEPAASRVAPPVADGNESADEAWKASDAAPLAGLNRQARRAFHREASKRFGPQAAQALTAAGRAAVTPTRSGPAATTSATMAG